MKNTLDFINSRWHIVEQKISELEDVATETVNLNRKWISQTLKQLPKNLHLII